MGNASACHCAKKKSRPSRPPNPESIPIQEGNPKNGKILTESLRLNLSIDEKDDRNDSNSNIANLVRESSLPAATKNTFRRNSAEIRKSELPRN